MKKIISFFLITFALTQVQAQSQENKFNLDTFKKMNEQILSRFAGNEGGHGGDTYVFEFVTLGKLIAAGFNSFTPEMLGQHNFTQQSFESVVNAVQVTSHPKEQMLLQNREMEAINFPDKLEIKINRERWRELSLEARIKLVMHEYFGILGVERDHYRVSMHFLSFVQMLTKEISSQQSYKVLSVNLFYGHCNYYPSLQVLSTCDPASSEVRKAMECSKNKARAKCVLADNQSCQIVDTILTPVVSTQFVGLRYCEVLTIAK